MPYKVSDASTKKCNPILLILPFPKISKCLITSKPKYVWYFHNSFLTSFDNVASQFICDCQN